jgi:hypothetical protein
MFRECAYLRAGHGAGSTVGLLTNEHMVSIKLRNVRDSAVRFTAHRSELRFKGEKPNKFLKFPHVSGRNTCYSESCSGSVCPTTLCNERNCLNVIQMCWFN